MNKKTFIKILRERLNILDESEILDIVNEYESIINDKVENGETEEKAISDFGDIDELVTEILKAYKINPKYKKEKVKIEDFEDFVKEGASKLSSFTNKIVNDIKGENISVEFIFEILIKAIILLIILAIARLPFMAVSYLGESILSIFLFPLNKILGFALGILIWLLYVVTCVIIGMAMFKNNIKFEKKNNDIKKEDKKKENKKKENNKYEKKEEPIIKENIKVSQILVNIIKVFTIIFILIPIVFFIIFLVIAIVILIYYLYVGINCFGIILFLIGLLILAVLFYGGIKDIFNNKRHHFLGRIITSIVFITLGCVLTVNWVSRIHYFECDKDKECNFNDYNYNTLIYNYTVNSNTKFHLYDNYTTYVDNTLVNDSVRIEVNYYDNFTEISENSLNENIEISSNSNINNNIWQIYNDVIDNLKEEKIYNYDNLYGSNIKIYGNENTILNLNLNDN